MVCATKLNTGNTGNIPYSKRTKAVHKQKIFERNWIFNWSSLTRSLGETLHHVAQLQLK